MPSKRVVKRTRSSAEEVRFSKSRKHAFRSRRIHIAKYSLIVINDLQDCYRILDVEPGATREEVKRAYRELVRVWHPDRFAHDPALQRKAQEKLKQINLAYEQICNGGVEGPRGRTASAESNSNDAAENTGSSGSGTSSNSSNGQQQEACRQPTPQQSPQTNWARRFVRVAVMVVIFAILKAVFSTNEHTNSRNTTYSVPYAQPSHADQFSQPPVIQSKPEPKDDSGVAKGSKEESAVAKIPEPDSPAASATNRDYFTVGSTKDEVLAVQGTPTKFTDTTLTYGLSDVYFSNGRVYSWNEYATSPLKAKLLPSTQVETKDYFTVGSTRDEVLAVQGTPTKFTDTTLTYGLSDVYFTNGKVTSWNEYATSPLKIRLKSQ
jgi:curved DNA-binding protein CbpA